MVPKLSGRDRNLEVQGDLSRGTGEGAAHATADSRNAIWRASCRDHSTLYAGSIRYLAGLDEGLRQNCRRHRRTGCIRRRVGSPRTVRLLLDTHIWLWSLLEPVRLAPAVAKALTDPDAEIWLSSISLWEAALLAERGRIEIVGEIQDWLAEAQARAPLSEAPLTHEIAMRSRSVDLPHDDPADRFIAATSAVLGLTLVTSDRRILRSKELSLLANH